MTDPAQPGPAPPADESSGEITQTDPFADRRHAGSANPQGRTPTEAPPHEPPTRPAPPRSPADAALPRAAVTPAERPADVARFGPGVPAPTPGGPAREKAENVWRGSDRPARTRRRSRLPQLLSSALTVILLAASGAVLYLRFHHSQPFHVTGVAISQRTPVACGVDLTGRIATNGAAGTVSYQWRVRPTSRQPRPKTAAVKAGQHSAPVHLVVLARGHGSTSKLVTLQVLAPDPQTVSVTVAVSC